MNKVAAERKRHLWLGLLGGPLVWATYFTIGYFFVEASCRTATGSTIIGLPGPAVIVVALTIVSLLLVLVAGRLAYQQWRQAAGPESGRFMAEAGLFTSGLFAFVILITGIPALVLAPCLFVP